MLTIIAKGKLRLPPGGEGGYMLEHSDGRLRYVNWHIHPFVGKTIAISIEEEEPILNENLEALLVPA